MTRHALRLLLAIAASLLAACASNNDRQASAANPTPASSPCPAGLPEGTRCYGGQDEAGAFYWVAIPADWNRVLVMHAHGGPTLGAPTQARVTEDLQRWAVTLRAGYAWAGSSYRRSGYGVTMAGEDTERLRQWFVAHFGTPRRTLLHGQSYGAGVAAKAAERYATVDGRPGPYDGLLLTSGVIGGGIRNYDFRLDLRVVYQYVCNNHPRPNEQAYPLWQGLPADSKLDRAQLRARIDECTGVSRPPAQRTAQQRANLKTILDTIGIQERSLDGHMQWATFMFRDMVQKRLDGRNPFGNVGAVYAGARDDAQLNANVQRFRADPAAVAALAADSDPDGRVGVPTLNLHAIDDPTAFVELESTYRAVRERAGTDALLVQTFSREAEHSYLSDPEYATLFAALLDWIDHGRKPTPESIAAQCKSFEARFGPGCFFDAGFRPGPLSARVPARDAP